jgi:hypothetical protein
MVFTEVKIKTDKMQTILIINQICVDVLREITVFELGKAYTRLKDVGTYNTP